MVDKILNIKTLILLVTFLVSRPLLAQYNEDSTLLLTIDSSGLGQTYIVSNADGDTMLERPFLNLKYSHVFKHDTLLIMVTDYPEIGSGASSRIEKRSYLVYFTGFNAVDSLVQKSYPLFESGCNLKVFEKIEFNQSDFVLKKKNEQEERIKLENLHPDKIIELIIKRCKV